MTERAATILFAGGGTGGHIYPNVAILERLREAAVPVEPHFLVSQRAIDAQMLTAASLSFIALAAEPWRSDPKHWTRFARGWFAAKRQVRELIASRRVAALVATGGFVSGPAIVAASQAGVPVALVNLDAVPGKANRRMARHGDALFSVYPTPTLPAAEVIGLPLRRVALGPENAAEARQRLGLSPDKHTLLVTGGSQGAQSVNAMVLELMRRESVRAALVDWQILHVCGPNNETSTRDGYASAGVDAKVMPFCDRMGDAWRAATLAISRAGAGSVAEAWANATPTLFFPYPMHKDEHQRLNAQPMVDTGGAVLFKDVVDPVANADRVMEQLVSLLRDASACATMRQHLRGSQPSDGAKRLADWIIQRLG